MKDNGGDSESTVVIHTMDYGSDSVKMGLENSEAVDIDTDLLCPDIIMEIRSETIIGNGEGNDTKQDDSSSLTFSPYDYNITGPKAQFKLNTEEECLRNAIYGPGPDSVKYCRLHCTACNAHLGTALSRLGDVFVHPLLGVVVCGGCFAYYAEGAFERDADGSERYCRWCGQGGGVLCCADCPMVFCKLCIRINFGAQKCAKIMKNDDWKCFNCEPHQIMAFKVQCYEYARYVQTKMCISDNETADYYMETDFTLCCSQPKRRKRKNSTEDDPDYDPNVKQQSEEEFSEGNEKKSPEKNKKILVGGLDSKQENIEETSNKKLKISVVDAKHRVALVGKNKNIELKILSGAPQTKIVTDASTHEENAPKPNQQLTFPIATNTPSHPPTNPLMTPPTKAPQKSIILTKKAVQETLTTAPTNLLTASNGSLGASNGSLGASNGSLAASESLLGVTKLAISSRETLGKALLDTASAGGAFGASILHLEGAYKRAGGRPAEMVALYNACQAAVSRVIGELLEVKREHILANVRPGTNSKLVPIPVSNFYKKATNSTPSFADFPVVGVPKKISSSQIEIIEIL